MRARGADAVAFLQSQLTSDVAALGAASAQLSAYCSAKGRMQASFVVWRSGDEEVSLACSASVLAATLKRLSMFVLRARCKLSDAGPQRRLDGVVGAAAAKLIVDTPVWGTRAIPGGTLVRLPDVQGHARAVTDVPADAAASPALALEAWRLLEVRSGIPIVEAATVDQFVPQMLNYEIVGGVDFRKGCYPGQEVVARSQYRGTIKRRMFLCESDLPMHAGQEVFHSLDASQPAGMIVNAAPLQGDTGAAALVEVKVAALDSGSLHLDAPDGARLRLGSLPYALPNEASLSV
jgi:folate-binding protein YgfZ